MENVETEVLNDTNALALETELGWLNAVLDTRFQLYFAQNTEIGDVFTIAPPAHEDESAYALFIEQHELNFSERLVLALTMATIVSPQMLDIFFTRNATYERGFTEFGGIKGNQHGGFLPTIETVLFVLAGNNIPRRFEALSVFDADSALMKSGALRISPPPGDEPFTCGQIRISKEHVSLFTRGKSEKPDYNVGFPARLLTSPLEWNDLILEEHVLDELAEISSWLKHEQLIMEDWGMSRVLKPGYRSLFYGPPGTGKTMAATLLGKNAGLDVYRIDLSMLVSKYIGETEKNLAGVFDQALNNKWLLFFDEADALFGKRTATTSSNDRYANQEVSYLLQRVEDYPGVIILATNLKANIDDAFTRRFQSMIHFPMPGPEDRLRIWQKKLPSQCTLEEKVDLSEIAQKHQLSGGAIINIVRYCALKALERGDKIIRQSDFNEGIKKEFKKEGKVLG